MQGKTNNRNEGMTTFYVTRALHQRVKLAAAVRGVPMQTLIRQVIESAIPLMTVTPIETQATKRKQD